MQFFKLLKILILNCLQNLQDLTNANWHCCQEKIKIEALIKHQKSDANRPSCNKLDSIEIR